MNRSILTGFAAIIFVCSLNTQSVLGQEEENRTGISKSSITIKTMRIENGDTIITEKHYNTEGDGHFEFKNELDGNDDGVFQFRYDMKPALPDTGDFGRIWMDMEEFMKSFDFDIDLSLNPYLDLWKEFGNFDPLLSDSILKYFESPVIDTMIGLTIPDRPRAIENPPGREPFRDKPKQFNREYQYRQPGKEIYITEEKKPADTKEKKTGREVPGFDVSRAGDEGLINLSFLLDDRKPSTIIILNAAGNELVRENILKGEGLYTRQFDFGRYESGVYYLRVKQGKKLSGKRIILQ